MIYAIIYIGFLIALVAVMYWFTPKETECEDDADWLRDWDQDPTAIPTVRANETAGSDSTSLT